MQIRNVLKHQIEAACEAANVTFGSRMQNPPRPLNAKGTAWQVTIGPKVKGDRCRRAVSDGRMLSSVSCWHAYRDFFKALYYVQPAARVRTALAKYDGVAAFEASFQATGWKNAGSVVHPVALKECCTCTDDPSPLPGAKVRDIIGFSPMWAK
jgi:hypothetical protein